MKPFLQGTIYACRLNKAVLLLLLLAFAFNACNIRRHIPQNSSLLSKVKIKGEPAANSEEIYGLLKQKPNKKILGLFRINMWSYLWANQQKIKHRREQKLQRMKNDLAKKRAELDATDSTQTKKRRKLQGQVNRLETRIEEQAERVNNLNKSVFEPPVVYDTALASVSANQVQAYLFNKGYYNNTVKFSSSPTKFFFFIPRKQRVNLTYNINLGDAFYVSNIHYYVYDSLLAKLVQNDAVNSLIQPGERYDGDLLTQERERLYVLMRNNGYYNFSREYIYYEIDSTLPGNNVNVGLAIANPGARTTHRIYKYNKIFIEPEFFLGDTVKKDTFYIYNYAFISSKLRTKPQILTDFIFFHKGDLFSLDDYQTTLTRLSQLNLYRFIDIQFVLDTLGTARKDTGLLTAHIRLTPLKKQEYSAEFELNSREESQAQIATSTNRSLGVASSFVYRNKNVLRKGLQFEIKPRAAVEIPISVFQDSRVIDTPSYEYGLSNSLIFPQLLFPWRVKDKTLRLSSQTLLNLNFIFENNRYFKRTTINSNLTYQISLKQNLKLFWTPLELSLVNTGFRNNAFEERVKATGDQLLINLFDRHIITGHRIAFTINQQPITNVARRYWFFRNSLETGGNILAGIDKITTGGKIDTTLTSKIWGINYYQYLRNEADVRFYFPVWRDNNLALRAIVGTGFPYGNSTILPFEKRFYVGGSNSIRAWRLRDLGPGSHFDTNAVAFDRSGDLKLEGNAEFRFPVYGLFKSAIFVDAGNVWTYKQDETRRNTDFKFDRFYKEFAVGAGLGLRFDFSFFVFRIDLALPVRDPELPEGQRIVIKNYRDGVWVQNHLNMNLGIGYPF